MNDRYEIQLRQARAWELVVTLKNPDGSVLNLTGYTAKHQFRPFPGSADLIVELSTANGKIVATALEGKLTEKLTDEDAANFTFRKCWHELIIESPAGDKLTIFDGPAYNTLKTVS